MLIFWDKRNDFCIRRLINSNLASIYYLGTGTSFDIKSKFPDSYQNFTVDNFIVGIQSMPSAKGQLIRDTGENVRSSVKGFEISKSYDNGILTISGTTQTTKIINSSGGAVGGSGTQTGVVFAYVVTGEISMT